MYRNRQQGAYPVEQQTISASPQSLPVVGMQQPSMPQYPSQMQQQMQQQQMRQQMQQQMQMQQLQQQQLQQQQWSQMQQPQSQMMGGMGIPMTNVQPMQESPVVQATNRFTHNSSTGVNSTDTNTQKTTQVNTRQAPRVISTPTEKIYPMLGNEFEPLTTENILVEKQVQGNNFKYAIMGKLDGTILKSEELSADGEIIPMDDPITRRLSRTLLAYKMKNKAEKDSLDAVYQTVTLLEHFPITSEEYLLSNVIKSANNLSDVARGLSCLLASMNRTVEDKIYLDAINEYFTKAIMLVIKLCLNETEKITSFREDYGALINTYEAAFANMPGVAKRYIFSLENVLTVLKESMEVYNLIATEAINENSGEHFKRGIIADSIGFVVLNTNSQLVKATNILSVFEDLEGTKAIREDVLPTLHNLLNDIYEADHSKLVLIVNDDCFIIKQTVSDYFTISKL